MKGEGLVIHCPYCGKDFTLDEGLSHQVREGLRKEVEGTMVEKERSLAQKTKELGDRERALLARRDELEKSYEARLKEMKGTLEAQAKKKAAEDMAVEVTDLKEQVKEKSDKLKNLQDMELQLRKEKRELAERLERMNVEVEEKLSVERRKMQEDVTQNVEQSFKLKERELQMKIDAMTTQIEELKRKAEQGSPRDRGEVMELELEDLLRSAFRNDVIEPVPKGLRGADVVQKVHDQGHHCGTIIWESKRTKAWSDAWIEKLKDDQREIGADCAVIMSTALPREIPTCACLGGVWITSCDFALPLADVLRHGLIQVARARTSSEGKSEKMEMLYAYLSGPEFRQRVEAIVEAFATMKNDLEKEKRAIMKAWAKREKQIERVIASTTRMYGEMHGIIGSSLPELPELEVKALADGADEDDEEISA